MQNRNYTHVIQVLVPLDLTSILSPENVPGIMAYLGINNEAELLEGVARDKGNQIVQALTGAGFEVARTTFDSIQNVQGTSSDDGMVARSQDETVAPTNQNRESKPVEIGPQLHERLIKTIKSLPVFAEKQIQSLTINQDLVDHLPSVKEIKKELGFDEDVNVVFDESDGELVAVLGFMNEDESLDFVAIHYDELDEIEDDDKSKEEKVDGSN